MVSLASFSANLGGPHARLDPGVLAIRVPLLLRSPWRSKDIVDCFGDLEMAAKPGEPPDDQAEGSPEFEECEDQGHKHVHRSQAMSVTTALV